MKKAKILSAILATALLLAGCDSSNENSTSQQSSATNHSKSSADSTTFSAPEIAPISGTVTIKDTEYDIASTTGLSLSGITNDDVVQIGKLVNLTYLNLDGNRFISDISPLANLTELRKLVLTGNQISDISPLKDLTNLISLDLSINQISDITPLANLTNLTNLYLGANQISEDDINWLQQQLPNCTISLY